MTAKKEGIEFLPLTERFYYSTYLSHFWSIFVMKNKGRNLKSSLHNQILNKIVKGPKGKIIFPSNFKGMGSAEAIRQALSRLVKERVLLRLAHGIYLFPQRDSLLGILYPSTDDIANAVAERDKIRILPSGLSSLNKLGLSTQVPTRAVYLTDGKPKTIKAGNRTIIFKTAAPKKFAINNKLNGIVIQALEELGKENITTKIIENISKVLHKGNKKTIREDANLAPEWIRQILFSITETME